MQKREMRKVNNLKVKINEDMLTALNNIFSDKENIKHKDKTVKKDGLVYLMYVFEYLNSYDKDNDKNNEVTLSSKKLNKIFHSRYNNYITFLIDNGFIIKVRNYSTDNKTSNVYKLSKQFLNRGKLFVDYEITDLVLLKKINYKGKRVTQEVYEKNKICLKKRRHLVCSFNNLLTMDCDGAVTEIKHFDTKKYRANYILINEYRNQIWKYSIKEKTDNRLHTPITRTNKILLKYIRYDNQILSEVDIKTSQPLFLYSILNTLYNENSKTEIYKYIHKLVDKKLIEKLLEIDIDLNELNQFGEEIVQRDLYIFLASNIDIPQQDEKYVMKKYIKKAGKRITKEHDTKRNAIKDVVMEALYGRSGSSNAKVIAIKNLFPSIFKVIDTIKRYEDNENDNFFPKLLQNIEAYVLLDLVAKKISEDHPGLPLFSKHDSLITVKNHINIVKNLVEKYMEEFIGIKDIKVEVNNWQ